MKSFWGIMLLFFLVNLLFLLFELIIKKIVKHSLLNLKYLFLIVFFCIVNLCLLGHFKPISLNELEILIYVSIFFFFIICGISITRQREVFSEKIITSIYGTLNGSNKNEHSKLFENIGLGLIVGGIIFFGEFLIKLLLYLM